jgi:hypothetical protein
MATMEWQGAGADPEPEAAAGPARGRLARLVNISAGGLSVTLIAGLAVWAYQLAVRDMSGIPVVRALEGPMRVQPADPGGLETAHQGLAVNRVAEAGAPPSPPEAVTLAPRSVDLAPEDVTHAALRGTPRIESPPPAPLEVSADAVAQAAAAAVFSLEAIPADVPGIAVSPRPRPRPAGDPVLRMAVASAADAIAAPLAAAEVDARALAVGTRLVQFGAYDTAEEARAAWDALAARFGTLMEGKGRVIEEAASGGVAFWRLRAAGFADLAEARRFCAAFIAERVDCIPVVVR